MERGMGMERWCGDGVVMVWGGKGEAVDVWEGVREM